MKRVSVIINNYNYSSYIEECILSAISQTYGNIELICVDDGSTDESMEIIRKYQDKLTIIQKKNGGQASALNAGFAASTGDLIIFLDSDDFLLSDAIKGACEIIPLDFEGVVQFLMNSVDAQGLHIGQVDNLYIGKIEPSTILSRSGPGNIKFPPTSGNIWTRKTLSAVMPIPETEFRISADAFLFSTVPAISNILSLNYTLSSYRIHGNNLYKSPFMYEKAVRNMEIYISRCKILAGLIGINKIPERWIISTPYYLGMVVSEKKFGSIALGKSIVQSGDLSILGKVLRFSIMILVKIPWARNFTLSLLHKRYI